jgi:hypothetical protein
MVECLMSLMLAASALCQVGDPVAAKPTEPAPRRGPTVDFEMSSGGMTVGFSREMGGAIVHLSVDQGPNLVNVHDPGRLIQQSYYAGASLSRPGHHPAWKTWPWNPIQGGDAFNFTPGASRFERLDDGRFFSESTGLNWPARDERLRSMMRQWTSFESPGVLRVECEFISDRDVNDDWGAEPIPRHQEVPAAYFVADLTRLVTHRDGQLVEFPHKMWNYAQPIPERWAACVGDDGRGVGVYSREATQVNIGKAGAGPGGPSAATTMHIAPIVTRALKPRDRLTYTYYLIVGDIETIRTAAKRLFEDGK